MGWFSSPLRGRADEVPDVRYLSNTSHVPVATGTRLSSRSVFFSFRAHCLKPYFSAVASSRCVPTASPTPSAASRSCASRCGDRFYWSPHRGHSSTSLRIAAKEHDGVGSPLLVTRWRTRLTWGIVSSSRRSATSRCAPVAHFPRRRGPAGDLPAYLAAPRDHESAAGQPWLRRPAVRRRPVRVTKTRCARPPCRPSRKVPFYEPAPAFGAHAVPSGSPPRPTP